MTFAWYGHLKFHSTPLLIAVVVSWGIAFVEYCLAVPANRIGHALYSTAELKTLQEVITLTVFIGFSAFFLREPLGWNHLLGFALIATGAPVVFWERRRLPSPKPTRSTAHLLPAQARVLRQYCRD